MTNVRQTGTFKRRTIRLFCVNLDQIQAKFQEYFLMCAPAQCRGV
nr:MAG TPA: hypothetical protein [Caudoviricetes sp.]